MTAQSYAPAPGDLLFRWGRPRRRKLAIAGFLVASAALHALCFYLFQVVYPPAISLLSPPAQVTVIAPTSDEARNFLNWLDAEDPALASQTQRSPDARAFQLPKVAYIPSYLSAPPQLRGLPTQRAPRNTISAMPPAPVPLPAAPKIAAPARAPTTLIFADELAGLRVTRPDLKFRASLRDAPENARFRIAVDSLGSVRYLFLEKSSGDAALDDQARRNLMLCRFMISVAPAKSDGLIWSTVTVQFGTDLELATGARGARAVIQVSLAALVTIYLLLFLAAVFLLWIFGEWNRRRREQRALRHRLRCVICAFEFEDRTPTLLPRCPRCGSLNERFKLDRI